MASWSPSVELFEKQHLGLEDTSHSEDSYCVIGAFFLPYDKVYNLTSISKYSCMQKSLSR